MIAVIIGCLLLLFAWYLEKRIRWGIYRSSVIAYTVGLVTGAGLGDTVSAAANAEKHLDQVETKIKLPRKTAYPLNSSNNYAEFALRCMVEYAKGNDLPDLESYCYSIIHAVRPYWDGNSLEW